jgi:succinoglycan biosynthesis protein ExoO
LAQSARRGPGAARNRALVASRGRWVAIFDSDDLMRPERLQTLHERARRDGALIVADNLLVLSDAGREPRAFLPNSLTRSPRWIGLAEFIDSNRLYSRLPDLGYLKPFISAGLLRASGIAYDETLRIGEDYDFLARLLARGLELRLEPSALYLYRRHATSTSHRMSGSDIAALIAAGERFACGLHELDQHARSALRRRRRSLDSMLLYDRAIAATKDGRYLEAAAIALSAPRIWPLLAGPARTRLVRLSRSARRIPGRTLQAAPEQG